MSIQRVVKDKPILEPRRTVIVNQSLATIGSNAFQVNLQSNQVDFIPTRMAVRQIAYTNLPIGGSPGVQGSDQGIFQVYCSLANQPICIVAVGSGLGFISTPEQVINILNYNPILELAVQNTGVGSLTNGAVPGQVQTLSAPTGFISLALEFF